MLSSKYIAFSLLAAGILATPLHPEFSDDMKPLERCPYAGAAPAAVVDSGADAFERTAAAHATRSAPTKSEPTLDRLRREAEQTHRPLSYAHARNVLFSRGGPEENAGRIEAFYTGRSVAVDGTRTPRNDCRTLDGRVSECELNTEHAVPLRELRRHLGASREFEVARSDLHHLVPTTTVANRARHHYGFGVTLCHQRGDCSFDEETRVGPERAGAPDRCKNAGESGCVVTVRADRRGDAARAQFYVSMRYALPIDGPTEAVLRFWHAEDPPNDYERRRNELIAGAQGNRNPFIDDPSLVGEVGDF